MALGLATFNVKNLFAGRDENERVTLSRKLDAIADTLRACNADVVGLQEVGSFALAHAIVQRLAGDGFDAICVGTPDARGIRCALIARLPFRFARVETASALPFPVFQENDPAPFGTRIPLRRGMIHAGVEAPGFGLVHVFVAHLKSPRPLGVRDVTGAEIRAESPPRRAEDFVRSVVFRLAEALHLQKLAQGVTTTITSPAEEHVALLGDFNDVPGSAVLRTLQGEGEDALFDCTESIDARARFSLLHAGKQWQVDHLLVTPNLGRRLESARFLNAALRDHGVLPLGGEEAMTADSDHAALTAHFT